MAPSSYHLMSVTGTASVSFAIGVTRLSLDAVFLPTEPKSCVPIADERSDVIDYVIGYVTSVVTYSISDAVGCLQETSVHERCTDPHILFTLIFSWKNNWK